MTLHMLRLDPDPFGAARWGSAAGVFREGSDDGYLWHTLLKAAFGDLAPKPFRHVERRTGSYIVGYTTSDKATLLSHAQAFADPAVAEAIGLPTLAVKQMPHKFACGQRFSFEVRVRPVVRTTRNDKHGKPGREVDAFLAAAHRTTEALSREEVYREWLMKNLGGSVSTSRIRIDALRRSRLLRRGAPDALGRRPLITLGKQGGGPDLIMAGELTVNDPEAFQALLARGLGRHRGFGFGMLLLLPCKSEIS
jgi:CRISPR system Cascade subunit CasE